MSESGLEAIAMAMKSDWTNEGFRQRHIILVFTDAPSHPLGFGSKSVHYPDGIPVDLAELERWWELGVPNGSYNPRIGRLVVFAPNAYPWNEMMSFERYWHVPSKAGVDVDEIELDLALSCLVDGYH